MQALSCDYAACTPQESGARGRQGEGCVLNNPPLGGKGHLHLFA